jgi:hemolysin activation/secretion protein
MYVDIPLVKIDKDIPLIKVDKKVDKKVKSKVEARCILLKQIDVNGNIIFTQFELLDKFINICLSGGVIKEILSIVTKTYMDEGYITTKAYIKEQNIQDGQIEITVQKGVVSNIIHTDTNETSIRLQTAFIGQTNKILNLRDIETSLESINRVPSSNASFKIKPGEKRGDSVISVKTKKTFPIHFIVGENGNANGDKETTNLTANISLDNLLRINDILSFNYNGSRIQEEYQSTQGHDVNYSFPIGSYLYEFIFSNTKYRQGVEGINDTYLSNGSTKGTRFKVNKILFRNKQQKLKLSAIVYHKDTKNYFSNKLIEVSSYKTTLAQMDLNHLFNANWGYLVSIYSFYRGTDWFHAKKDSDVSVEIDRIDNSVYEFEKHSLNLNLTYYFKDKSINSNSNLHFQYTNDNLLHNDKLTIGSDYTVRGYSSSNVFGNNGWYLRNDIIKTFNFQYLPSLFKNLSIFIGMDHGEIACQKNDKESCGVVQGGAFGLRTNGKYFSSNLTYSKPLRAIGKNFKKEELVKYNFSIKF